MRTAAWAAPAILTLAARPSFASRGSNGRPSDDDSTHNNPPVDEPKDPKPKGNNGVGNGEDPQPPGNPPINDGPGTAPGNPGSQGKGQGNKKG